MSEIPDDLIEIASAILLTGTGYFERRELIARAIMTERERSKTRWLEWHRKRSEASQKFWLRASKKALDGDLRELRNRIALCEAEPLEVVLSEEP